MLNIIGKDDTFRRKSCVEEKTQINNPNGTIITNPAENPFKIRVYFHATSTCFGSSLILILSLCDKKKEEIKEYIWHTKRYIVL